MTPELTKQVLDADEARNLAIDWQSWQSEQSLSYEEMIDWQHAFTELAEQYDLTEEFEENGII